MPGVGRPILRLSGLVLGGNSNVDADVPLPSDPPLALALLLLLLLLLPPDRHCKRFIKPEEGRLVLLSERRELTSSSMYVFVEVSRRVVCLSMTTPGGLLLLLLLMLVMSLVFMFLIYFTSVVGLGFIQRVPLSGALMCAG